MKSCRIFLDFDMIYDKILFKNHVELLIIMIFFWKKILLLTQEKTSCRNKFPDFNNSRIFKKIMILFLFYVKEASLTEEYYDNEGKIIFIVV